jgi:hypothetical protein
MQHRDGVDMGAIFECSVAGACRPRRSEAAKAQSGFMITPPSARRELARGPEELMRSAASEGSMLFSPGNVKGLTMFGRETPLGHKAAFV